MTNAVFEKKMRKQHKLFDLNRMKRLFKEGLWVILGKMAAVSGALVLVRVLTEYLTPEEYGQLALGLTVATLVNQVVMGGITNGVGRFYSIANEKEDLGGYLLATRRLLIYGTSVVVAISLILSICLLWLGYSQWIALTMAALVFSVFSAYSHVLSGIQNAARQRAVVALHGGLDAWLKIGLALGVIFWLGTTSYAVVIGYACSSLLITSSQLIFLRRIIPKQKLQESVDHNWLQQIWTFSLPFSVWGIFTWMQLSSGRWALQTFASTADVGKYAVVYQLGYGMPIMLIGLVVTFIKPIIFQRAGSAESYSQVKYVRKTAKLITLAFSLITFVSFVMALIFHDYFFSIFVGQEYQQASVYNYLQKAIQVLSLF